MRNVDRGPARVLRRFILLVLPVIAVAAMLTGSTSGQQTRDFASTPKDFQAFYTKFRSAVTRGDKQAVAAMTKFPFKYGFDAGDEGTFSQTQFIRRYNDILGGGRKLFTRARPRFYVEAGAYSLSDPDDASTYVFKKVNGSYRFTGYFSEP